jgi:glycogen operon protein
VARVRERVKRSLLATLAVSQGVPMLAHGDEVGRTQDGNNNAYCHDGPLTWVHWDLTPPEEAFLAFARRVMAIRADEPALRRRAFFPPEAAGGSGEGLTWLRADGAPMAVEDWNHDANHLLGMLLHGARPLLLLLNGGGRSRAFPLSAVPGGWRILVDTAHEGERAVEGEITLAPHSLVLLTARSEAS